ncbi:hypothetical protein Cgig2_013249 [Carnegiea gigantea]|uniref:Uncharacterized protein n=1 Tax=Carnegiea gigantea TaxID=171969 RepID=A0A9Q1GK86_9CARY|nr:hypothetical protein Cgig2_013249 [Carnegiea gigantea]
MLLLSQSHQVKILHHHNFRPPLPNIYDYDNPSSVICDLGSRSATFSSTAHLLASLLPLNHHGAMFLIFQSHQFKIFHHHNLRPALPNIYDYEILEVVTCVSNPSMSTHPISYDIKCCNLQSEVINSTTFGWFEEVSNETLHICFWKPKWMPRYRATKSSPGHSSMSLPSPTSPLSFNSNSDGSSDLQDTIFSDNPPTQPSVTPMLDGGRFDHSGNPHQALLLLRCPQIWSGKSWCQTHPPESDSVPPQINIEGPHVSTTQPMVLYRIPNLAPANPEGIILANLSVMAEDPPINDEPLDATNEVINEDEDIDIYLNLHNIEDIEMSTDSCKRTRYKKGEEATSQAN